MRFRNWPLFRYQYYHSFALFTCQYAKYPMLTASIFIFGMLMFCTPAYCQGFGLIPESGKGCSAVSYKSKLANFDKPVKRPKTVYNANWRNVFHGRLVNSCALEFENKKTRKLTLSHLKQYPEKSLIAKFPFQRSKASFCESSVKSFGLFLSSCSWVQQVSTVCNV